MDKIILVSKQLLQIQNLITRKDEKKIYFIKNTLKKDLVVNFQ